MTYANKKRQAGFTIIEMILAMTFVAALLIGIALAVIKLGSTYNRGITVTEVNQAGRDLNTEFTQTLRAAGPMKETDSLIKVTKETTPVGGRLCTGQVSYVWNYASALQSMPADGTVMRYADATPTDESRWVRLVRIVDTDRSYCTVTGGGYKMKNIPTSAVVTELIKPGDRRLNIYDLAFSLANEDDPSGQRMYSLTYTIGAGNATAVMKDGTATVCRPPNDPQSDIDYCTVQQFETVIRAGNGASN